MSALGTDAGRFRGTAPLSHRQFSAALVAAALLVSSAGSTLAQGATSTGTSFASVSVSGEANLGPLLSLRLSTGSLTFDLRATRTTAPACVLGAEPDDVTTADVAPGPLFGAGQVLPASTSFQVTAYPAIVVEGGQGATLGPLPLVGTDAAVVCYRTFTLGMFSNTDGWQVTVDRFELPGTPVIENLYLAAVCRGDAATGMWALGGEAQVTLLSGRSAGACAEALVVVALKLGNEPAGTSAVGLRYTLMSAGRPEGVH